MARCDDFTPASSSLVTALITGASGFIGASLCERLRSAGWVVRAVMRHPAQGPWDDAVHLDLGAQPIPPDLLAGVDCIFHLAGKAHAVAESGEGEDTYRIANVQSTLDLLAAARAAGVRGFVYFSSVKAIAEGSDGSGDPAQSWTPDTAYGRSKRAAEQAVLTSDDVPHAVVIRPSLVYGPHPKGYLELMIRAVRAGWFPPLPESGKGRSMIHRDDLVAAALLCATDPRASGRAYVVTDGVPYSTRQIYDLILNALGRPVPGWSLPIGVLHLAARLGDGAERLLRRRLPIDSEVLDKLIGSAFYDGDAIRHEFGFEPQRTLSDSMAEMVATTRL